MIDIHQNFCLDPFGRKVHVKFYKLPHFTYDITGQHYRPVLSNISLPELLSKWRRQLLKFRSPRSGQTREKEAGILLTIQEPGTDYTVTRFITFFYTKSL